MDTVSKTPTRDEVSEKVKALVIEALHAQKMANQVTVETYLENLGLDSLNIVDIFLGIERDFDIEINDEDLDLAALESIGTLVDFVMRTKGLDT